MADLSPSTIRTFCTRLIHLGIALTAIPLGLVARSFRDDADTSGLLGFVTRYLGDTLWAVMFFFLFASAMPQRRAYQLAAITLVFTLSIETSQLYHGEPLATLRAFAPTRFLLGSQFLWSDVVCLIVGTTLAAIAHSVIRLTKQGKAPALGRG